MTGPRASARTRGRWMGSIAVVCWWICGVPCLFPVASVAADVTGEQVKAATRRGVEAIQRRQMADGGWAERFDPGGETCLATLALLTAGQAADSDAMQRALARIRQLPNQTVYVTSLKLLALARADAIRFRADIEAAAKWLIAAQNGTGLWNYTPEVQRFDHSNSQFAILALGAAVEIDIDVPVAVWTRAQQAVSKSQNKDGGWAYQAAGPPSYGSMTAANIANLLIFNAASPAGREKSFRNGVAPGCGEYKSSRDLLEGLRWMSRNFDVTRNPQRGREYLYYWLYAAERVGVLSGERYFGQQEWYREGARFLVQAQRPNGLWGNDLVDSCFAVLFLAKGHKPLLIQKLKWSDDDAWNLDRFDLANLIGFIGNQLGESGAWQVVPFDAPLEDWLAGPVLYIQGHRFPKWNDAQRAKIRAYVEQGGTLLAEACCGRQDFRTGFEQFAAMVFPEVPLRDLPNDHPVYQALLPVDPYGLQGLDLGCRTSVIYSPHDLSCLWEQKEVPTLSEQAYRIGTNVVAYASGRQPLRDRLDLVTLPGAARPGTPPPAGALRLAQVAYDGDWRPDPNALVRLAEFLRDQLRLDVVSQYRTPRLTDADLIESPILFITGHHGFNLSGAEKSALAAHLRRGGFLWADACCGKRAFDESFRALMGEVLPGIEAVKLPPDHSILRGAPGFPLEKVRYKEAVLRANTGLATPELWGWLIDGRLAVVYSPHALACGMDGHVCYDCRGVDAEDARRMAANIVLYALTH